MNPLATKERQLVVNSLATNERQLQLGSWKLDDKYVGYKKMKTAATNVNM